MTLKCVSISYARFRAVATYYSRTLSRTARPTVDETVYTYDCSFTEFIAGNVYPVWFVDPARTRFLNYDDPQAQPILVSELAFLQQLVENELSSWYRPELGPITRATFVTLRCTGCNRRVLIDGVHRALWLAAHNGQDIPAQVTELSGRRWPPGTPDINVVCTCNAPEQHVLDTSLKTHTKEMWP